MAKTDQTSAQAKVSVKELRGMNKKKLPDPIDLETLVEAAAFQLLLSRGEAVAPELIADRSGINPAKVVAVLDQLHHAGDLRRDANGGVIGSAGLSVVPDRHEIEVEGRRFWTWCAWDIFGIFGVLEASGRAISPSQPDRKPIEVRFVRGRPQPLDAVLYRPDAELMECCDNVYEQWCANSNLFRSREAAETWAIERGLTGRVLTADEAADLATEQWKSMAEAARVNIHTLRYYEQS